MTDFFLRQCPTTFWLRCWCYLCLFDRRWVLTSTWLIFFHYCCFIKFCGRNASLWQQQNRMAVVIYVIQKKKDLIRTRQVTMEKHNSDKCVKPNRSSHDQSSDGVGDKHSLYCHQVIMNPCALGFSDTIFCFSQKRKMSVLAVRSPCI